MTAVGCAVFEETSTPKFLESVTQTGRQLKTALEALSERFGFGEVRGKGLLLALDLKKEVGKGIVDRAFEKGLLLNSPRPDTLRFMPALTVTQDEVGLMIQILDWCLGPLACRHGIHSI